MDGQLEILWEFKTSSTTGRRTRSPGAHFMRAIRGEGDYVYFGPLTGNTYAPEASGGRSGLEFQARDSQKSTPPFIGDRVINSGLDITCMF